MDDQSRNAAGEKERKVWRFGNGSIGGEQDFSEFMAGGGK